MVFYDDRKTRKLYFRLFVAISVVFFLMSPIDIITSIVTASPKNLQLNTSDYYNYYYSSENDKKLALTFDDGPSSENTLQIVDVLKKHNVPATFFFVGSNVFKHQHITEKVYDAGFEIGSHSFTHSYNVHKSKERLKWELTVTNHLIKNITGQQVLLYRPPFLLNVGIDPTLNPDIPVEKPLAWAVKMGYIPVGADIDSMDWKVSSEKELITNVKKAAPDGHIILLHDGGGDNNTRFTLKALEKIIIDLKAEGYEFVTVSEILGLNKNTDLKHFLYSGANDEITNGEISKLQKFLKEEGCIVSVSGEYETTTEQAVQSWQAKHNIVSFGSPATTGYGVVGPKTRKKISEESENKIPLRSIMSAEAQPYNIYKNYLQRMNISFISLILPALSILIKAILILVVIRIIFILLLYFIAQIKKDKPLRGGWYKGVSVIIPAYNEEKNIKATLYSVLGNKQYVKEIIVVDDGSTDRTAEIVRTVKKNHIERIRLIQTANHGKAHALNVGFHEAKSEIIVTLDGDSIFDKNAVNNLVKHFKNKKVVAVAGKVCPVRTSNALELFQNIEYIVSQNIEKKSFSLINAVGVIPGPIGAWRKEDVLACGGYSEDTIVEDQDLTLAILRQGKKIIFEPKAIAYTEAPHSAKDFIKQRSRWIFGTFQCFWKYRADLFSRNLAIGWIVLPNIALYGIFIPSFYLLIDTIAVLAIIFGFGKPILLAYILFTLFDILYTIIAFWEEKNNYYFILLIPFQRIYYRQIMCFVVVKSIIKAVEGTRAFWSKIGKTGCTQKYYVEKYYAETAGEAIA